MKNIIFQIIIIFVFTTNILQANPPKIDGFQFYNLGDDDMPWFNLNNEKDLIDLSNIDCQWSHGKRTKCRMHLSPLYNFPKNGVLIQNENVKCVPDITALKICQNRLLEKKFFESLGIETTLINETKDFNESNFKPLIFKTKSQGYDGKGQIRCNSYNEFNKVLEKIDLDNYIVEKYVDDLDQEVSVIVSVSNGIVSLVSLNLNFHRNGILCETYSLQISENKF